MIPDSVLVIGKRYRITATDKLETDDYGNCDYDQCRIDVQTGPCLYQLQDTLLHEVVHAVDHEMHCGMSEPQVRRLATGLLAALRDNPALVAYLTAD